MELRIVKLDETTTGFLPHEQQPFDVIGRFVPLYDGGSWSYQEVLCRENRQKTYEDDTVNPKDYIDNREQAIFLAVYHHSCVGSIRISTWLGTGYIENLAVDAPYRHLGVGKELMDAAVAWCREAGLSAITLETQDNNLQACRFYTKYGFALCGMNTQKYASTKYKDEIALYFVLKLA